MGSQFGGGIGQINDSSTAISAISENSITMPDGLDVAVDKGSSWHSSISHNFKHAAGITRKTFLRSNDSLSHNLGHEVPTVDHDTNQNSEAQGHSRGLSQISLRGIKELHLLHKRNKYIVCGFP